jgi:hypothetical protein
MRSRRTPASRSSEAASTREWFGTLLGLGRASVPGPSPEDVIVPAGFTLDHKL